MTGISRRTLIASAAAATALTACGNGVGSRGPAIIDSRVNETLAFMEQTYPGTRDLRSKASGLLVMPLVTEAGFGIGGSYGRGALLVNDVTVDYYSQAQGSFGLQIGAQQFAHVLFFMTEEALAEFRSSPGWAAGGDIEYTVNNKAENLTAETTTSLAPVIGIVFGQAGLLAGATVEGTKYTRIIP
jgi:lipid-binding SYLF domain-containing protein